MKMIQYDNGTVNRYNGEKYPNRWLKKIAPIAGRFFDKHPFLLTDGDIEEICCGEVSEVMEKYCVYEGFQELHGVLDEYFNSL